MKKLKVTFLAALLLIATTKVVHSSTTSNRVLGISNSISLVQSTGISTQKEAIIPTYVIVTAVILATGYTAASSHATNQPKPEELEDNTQRLYFID